MDLSESLERLASLVEQMDVDGVRREVDECLARGLPATRVIPHGLSAGMRRVGEKFKTGEVYMPEVLVSCDVYYKGLEAGRPFLKASDGRSARGKMILGTIHGDIHTVGKDVAAPVFQAAG